MIRVHQIGANQVLDRRILEELFLEAARRLDKITNWNIGNNTIKRTGFESYTFTDMYFSYEHDLNFNSPRYSHRVPCSSDDIKVRGSYYEASLTWSLELNADGADCYFVAAWPIVNGEALWHLLDYRQHGTLKVYSFTGDPGETPIPDQESTDEVQGYSAGSAYDEGAELNLGHSGFYSGLPGDGQTCIMMITVGSWLVKGSAITLETRYR